MGAGHSTLQSLTVAVVAPHDPDEVVVVVKAVTSQPVTVDVDVEHTKELQLGQWLIHIFEFGALTFWC